MDPSIQKVEKPQSKTSQVKEYKSNEANERIRRGEKIRGKEMVAEGNGKEVWDINPTGLNQSRGDN